MDSHEGRPLSQHRCGEQHKLPKCDIDKKGYAIKSASKDVCCQNDATLWPGKRLPLRRARGLDNTSRTQVHALHLGRVVVVVHGGVRALTIRWCVGDVQGGDGERGRRGTEVGGAAATLSLGRHEPIKVCHRRRSNAMIWTILNAIGENCCKGATSNMFVEQARNATSPPAQR